MAHPPVPSGVLAQLETLDLDPARPLLVVDADEVLVVFAADLARFVGDLGIDMHLTQYKLEGAMTVRRTGLPVPFDETIALIDRYFETEAAAQAPIAGAAEALARLEPLAQIVVLTNVPAHARAARIARLAALEMAYPLIENNGGKGPALAWMAQRAGAPAAFVDDSPNQIESAAADAPDIRRVHFVGSALVADIMPACPEAHHRVADWDEAETVLRDLLC